MIDDAPRIFPMLVPTYVKTTVTKTVAKKGSANRQRGEKRTVTKNVKIKQFRVPDLVERGLGNPLRGQHYKLGVKVQPHKTILHGATEYRESEHALFKDIHSDSETMITRGGSFEVGPHNMPHIH
jgi:hypothetical protein